MEKFEQIIETYYKANDGRRFQKAEDCEFYEYALDKYINGGKHHMLENGEGNNVHFFYIKDAVEAKEVQRFCQWYLHHSVGLPNMFPEEPMWACVGDDWYDYENVPVMTSLTEYINNIEETIVEYQQALSDAKWLKEQEAPV